ncbi:hypothetical protein BDB01DRAFT_589550 [Pilobolus umbonatus]|nr:hypothetical protein BDB01DRAFT_589550 [Pilobolus umbonatus]
MLYNEYQRRAELPGWFNAGHWQYLILYTSIILSFLCSLAICTHAICCKRGHILRGDKCLGLVNSVVLFITVLLITCVTNQEPWTNSRVEVVNPDRGYITYCRLLNRGTDATYPLLYQR